MLFKRSKINLKSIISIEYWYNVEKNFRVFFKRRRDFKQRFNIWNSFYNSENICKIDFRIQIIAHNDDKYEKKKFLKINTFRNAKLLICSYVVLLK